MQTFLPYPDFAKCAACLDNQRLNKQIVEAEQIHATLVGESKCWANHPAVKMWKGYATALVDYTFYMVQEWEARGFKKDHASWMRIKPKYVAAFVIKPAWLGRPDFHLSHQSNLVRKKPEHYRVWFPDVPSDLEYVWPVP